MTLPEASDHESPALRAWRAARAHRSPPPFDAGWPSVSGHVAGIGRLVTEALDAGRVLPAVELLDRIAFGDGPQAEALRAVARHFREAGIANPTPNRRGPRGLALRAEKARIVEDTRLAYWLAQYAREMRALARRGAVPEVDARCFAAYIVAPDELPGADWAALAEGLLFREGLDRIADARDWRQRFRDAFGDRLESVGLSREHLRGVTLKLGA